MYGRVNTGFFLDIGIFIVLHSQDLFGNTGRLIFGFIPPNGLRKLYFSTKIVKTYG